MPSSDERMDRVERNLDFAAERLAAANASLAKTHASLDKTSADLDKMIARTEASLGEMKARQMYHDEALERHDKRMRELDAKYDERVKQILEMISENNSTARSLLAAVQHHQRRLDLLEGNNR